MRRRYVSPQAWPALLVGLGVALAACYDPPQPDCGFRCGPDDACPADYTCGADRRCHRNGASPALQCAPSDAAPDLPDATQRPRVVNVLPAPDATDVAVDTLVRVRFSEHVVNVSDETLFVFESVSGTPRPGAVTYDAVTRTATYDPTAQLPAQTAIGILASAAIVDVDGMPLLDPTEFEFSTGADTVPPALQGSVPGDGATGVAPTVVIVASFDEPVVNATDASVIVDANGPIAGTVGATNGGRDVTFTPSAPLPPATVVTVTLSTAITDAAGNALPAPVAFAFTTAP